MTPPQLEMQNNSITKIKNIRLATSAIQKSRGRGILPLYPGQSLHASTAATWYFERCWLTNARNRCRQSLTWNGLVGADSRISRLVGAGPSGLWPVWGAHPSPMNRQSAGKPAAVVAASSSHGKHNPNHTRARALFFQRRDRMTGTTGWVGDSRATRVPIADRRGL